MAAIASLERRSTNEIGGTRISKFSAMPKSDPDLQTTQATRRVLEDIMRRALLAYHNENPTRSALDELADNPEAAGRRLILISRLGLVSDCLRASLHERGFEVVLYPLCEALKPGSLHADLAVICINQHEAGALALIRQRIDDVRAALPQLPVMALIEQADRDISRDLAGLGLAAVVLGSPSVKIAVAAIHLVLLGGSLVTAEIHLSPTRVAGPDHSNEVNEQAPEECSELARIGNFTERELALLARLREGMQNKMIAHELGIAESTVKVHLRNIMTKLHATNRTQVAYMLAGHQRPGLSNGKATGLKTDGSPDGTARPATPLSVRNCGRASATNGYRTR